MKKMKKLPAIAILTLLLSTMFFTCYSTGKQDLDNSTISSEQYEKGFRYNTHGWIYLHIEGEPYKRGYQHGYLLAHEIIDIIGRWQAMFPHKFSWQILKIDAMRLFWRRYSDEYQQEIKGIADGVKAKIGNNVGPSFDYKDILTLNEMYESLSRFRTYSVHPFRIRNSWWFFLLYRQFFYSQSSGETQHIGKCSSFLATGESTKDGGIVAGHSTFGWRSDGENWWHTYICGRWNVLLDIKPTKGNRMLFSTSPGLIWSDEDYYQNDAGMILMETTLSPLGPWTRFGDPIVVRARKAIQYSDSIEEMVDFLLKNNNGLMANDWLMGDTKTGEIASLELAIRHHSLTRTNNGFLWSCNNAKDDNVRWVLNSFTRLGIFGRIFKTDFEPSLRDIKFEELLTKYNGKIDVDIAKKILSTSPIVSSSTDCKITSTKLIDNFGLWVFMGKPDGSDLISEDFPFKKPKPRYTDFPACGWVQIFSPTDLLAFISDNKQRDDNKGRILWEHETSNGDFGNAIYSSPIKNKDIIYTTSWNGNISAFNINSNNLIWETNLGWSSSSSPIIVKNNIFVGSSDGLYALEKDSGEILWNFKMGAVSSIPVYVNGVVYCGSHDGNIYAINSKNGDLEWTFETNDEIYGSPVVKNNVLFIGSNDGYMYAINIKDKELKWKFKTDRPIVSSSLIVNKDLYFGSWDGNLYSLETETGKLKWKFTTGWGIDSTPAFFDDTIFVGSEDTNFYAIDAEDGTLKWIFPTNGGIQSSATVYGGFVFFGSSDGKLYAVNALSGDLEWCIAPDYFIEGIYNYKTKPIISSPLVDRGKVYIGSINGNLYCFDAQTIEITKSDKEDITIPIDTWLFLVIPLLITILITGLYLKLTGRKNS